MVVDLLFVTVLVGTIFLYFLSGKNILSPTLVLFGIFTFSTFWVVVNINYFGLDISFKTYFVIIFSLFAWGIGDFYAKYYYERYKRKRPRFILKYKIVPSNIVLIISTLIVSVGAIEEYFRFIKIGEFLGGKNFFSYYALAREYVVGAQNLDFNNMFAVSRSVGLLLTLSKIITYSFIVIFLFNTYYSGEKKYKYLIPVIVYFPILFFTTSRSSFLSFFSFCFLATILIRYQARGWGFRNYIVFKNLLIPVFVIVILFFALGYIRENGTGNLFSTELVKNYIGKYSGSSIFGLNFKLNRPIPHGPFARETFPILYVILQKFGYHIKEIPLHNGFFYWKNNSSNIYTALWKPIIDFSILGMLITRIILGFLYGLFIRRFVYFRNSPYHIFGYVILPMIYFPLMLYFANDLFYYFFELKFLYTIIFLLVFQIIVNKSKVLITDES